MIKVLLLNDTSDHGNWGSNACAEGLKTVLRKALPDLALESVPSRWTKVQFRQAPAWLGGQVYSGRCRGIDRLSRPFRFVPEMADDFEAVADDWMSGRGGPAADAFLTAARRADVVVFNAEGSTYRNNGTATRCLFALWLARTRLGVPGLFLNGTVHLTGVDPLLPGMVRRSFPVLAGVAVREPRSLRNVGEIVPGLSVELVPDTVFGFTQADFEPEELPAPVSNRPGGRRFFALSSSMLVTLLPGHLRHGVEQTAVYELVRHLQAEGFDAVILARDREDLPLARALAAATGALVAGPEAGYLAIGKLLGRAAFLVSGRYHHLILAAVAGCPGVALRTTSHKVDGLCELFDGELGTPFDSTWMRPLIPAIVERSLALAADRGARERVQSVADRLRAQVPRLGEMVTAAVDGKAVEAPCAS